MTSLPRAMAAMVSSTAAALLLTTVAASAPVSVHSNSSTMLSRSPRPPVARSYSRLLGPAIMASRCCSAASASSARPRLVWITVPVRLSTRRKAGASRACTRPVSVCTKTVAAPLHAPAGPPGSGHAAHRAGRGLRWPPRCGHAQPPGLRQRLAQQSVNGRQVFGAGLGTVDDGFGGPGHHAPPGSGGGSGGASGPGSPKSSIRLTPCRCSPVSDTSRSNVRLARSSATGSTRGRGRCGRS